MKIKIKKLSESTILPTKAHDTDACFDIYASLDEGISIRPHRTRKIPVGFSTEIPHGYYAAVYARSGLGINKGLRPANCVGIIDSDYRGEIIVAIHNDSHSYQIIYPGDRIAQFVLMERFLCDWEEVKELDETDRGEGGFGSTGK